MNSLVRNPAKSYRRSVSVLILANAIPLIGVFAWGWSTFEIVALYWLENLILGCGKILTMLSCRPGTGADASSSPGIHTAAKFFIIPFFTVHYFGFCAVHGVFVFAFLGSENGGSDPSSLSPFSIFETFAGWPMFLAIGGLFASHLFSFVTNYLGKGEFRRLTTDQLMFSPYGRVVVLHIAILFGGFAIMSLGSPIALLVLFVILKTALDLAMHIRSHLKAAASRPTSATF